MAESISLPVTGGGTVTLTALPIEASAVSVKYLDIATSASVDALSVAIQGRVAQITSQAATQFAASAVKPRVIQFAPASVAEFAGNSIAVRYGEISISSDLVPELDTSFEARFGEIAIAAAVQAVGGTVQSRTAQITGTVATQFTRDTTAPVSNQTAPFGALTLASSGDEQVIDDNGDPITNASDDGTGTATGYTLSSGGVITATSNGSLSAQDGATIDITCDQGTLTVTLSVEADTYSAAGNTQMIAALGAAESAGGVTVKLRDGAYGAVGGSGGSTGRDTFANQSYAAEVVVTAYNKSEVVFDSSWIEGCDRLTIDGVTFQSSTYQGITIYGRNSNITIQNCDIGGATPWDPEGDWSTSLPPSPRAIGGNASQGNNTNISILNNTIKYARDGIVTGNMAGVLRIEGNVLDTIYEDGIKVSQGPTETIITDNFLQNLAANSNDASGAHCDHIQFLGAKSGDWTGITIARNILLVNVSRSTPQGIFMSDSTPGLYYTADIFGNLIISKGEVGPTGIRIDAVKDTRVIGNTCVSNTNYGGGPAIEVGIDGATGTNTVQYNVADGYILETGVTGSDNITLGSGGATIAYGTVFDGPTFTPADRAEALTNFSMLANGPLDADNSGGPSLGDIGAIGTGFITPATTSPGNDGSTDESYLPGAPAAVTYAAYDYAGTAVTETDLTEMRVSLDGGSTYDTLTNLSLTATVSGGEIVISGAMAATTTTPLVTFEQSGTEPYGAFDNSELSPVSTREDGTAAPANPVIYGSLLTPTKLGEPV